jgi:hypothetical protein
VPERLIDKQVDVYKYLNEIRIHYKHEEVARHERVIDQINVRKKCEGHHVKQYSQLAQENRDQTERALSGQHEILDAYIKALKMHNRGVRPLTRLLHLKQTYPHDAFMAAVTRAHTYGLYDIARLEELILKHIAGDFFNLSRGEE